MLYGESNDWTDRDDDSLFGRTLATQRRMKGTRWKLSAGDNLHGIAFGNQESAAYERYT